jgi:hypothetical protein
MPRKPTTETEDAPIQELNSYINHLTEWRDEYLALVGAPNDFRAE